MVDITGRLQTTRPGMHSAYQEVEKPVKIEEDRRHPEK